MTRTANKRGGGARAQWEITPIIAGKLELEKRDSRYCRTFQSSFSIWEVSCSDRSYEVDLSQRTCGCFKWQLTGIPCKHACAAINKTRARPEDYVDEYFKKEAYIRAYTPMIYPVPGEHGWTRTDSEDIDPPKFEKHAGRPKKNRKRGAEEAPKATCRARMTRVTCSN